MTETMHAAVNRRYGPPEVVHVEEIPRPEPGPGEVLIRVEATAVNAADWRMRSLDVPSGFGVIVRLMFGWSKPRNPVLGVDGAGVVVQVGTGRSDVAPGDRVVVSSDATRGAHAQFMCVPRKAALAVLPDKVSFDQAAALAFGGTTAMWFLDKAGARAGQSLLVNGASGAVGLALVTLASARGMNVTGICSGVNTDVVRAAGADAVIDYRQTPFADITGRWDMVADLAGTAPWELARAKVAPGGRFLMIEAPGLGAIAFAAFRGGEGRKVIAGTAIPTSQMLADLVQLVVEGVWTPVIDSTYPLAMASAAHARVDSRRKVGSVLLHPQG